MEVEEVAARLLVVRRAGLGVVTGMTVVWLSVAAGQWVWRALELSRSVLLLSAVAVDEICGLRLCGQWLSVAARRGWTSLWAWVPEDPL